MISYVYDIIYMISYENTYDIICHDIRYHMYMISYLMYTISCLWYHVYGRVRILPSLFVTSRLKKNWTVCVDSIRVIQPFKDGPHAVRDTKFPGFEFPWHDFSLWSVSLCFSYSATFSFSLILLEMIPYCVATLIFAEIVVNRRQKVQI